jgi:hypothetical protein
VEREEREEREELEDRLVKDGYVPYRRPNLIYLIENNAFII